MADKVNLNIMPVPINPVVDCAADTVYTFVVKDGASQEVDLSEFTVAMQMRPYPRAKRLYDEFTEEDGRLSILGSRITVRFPAEITKTYKFAKAFYDLVIVSPQGLRYRVAEGEVDFRPEVTV